MKNIEIYVNSICKEGQSAYCNKLIYESYSKSNCVNGAYMDSSIIELKSIVDSLKMLKQPCAVNLYTKCEYIVKIYEEGTLDTWVKNKWTTNNGYRRSSKEVSNKELWFELYMLSKIHNIKLIRVSKKHEIMKKMKWYMSKKIDGNLFS
ncbi:hypothetical protein BFS06_12315 [Clostridium perfringens]|uniref:Putative ribonuclease H n=1 Tax=Clostridium perfringens TaxID=1502 RepID=A0A140GR30_CLOPF|nr:RNase H family protein [Clostridium perfringens]AMN30989.1 putative ribonuclease H [Clostridium perfringens]TBX14985.1 hypothetical protein BFS06_12315 [Clostridium perfringens]